MPANCADVFQTVSPGQPLAHHLPP